MDIPFLTQTHNTDLQVLKVNIITLKKKALGQEEERGRQEGVRRRLKSQESQEKKIFSKVECLTDPMNL